MPMVEDLLDWSEQEISLFYSGAGIVVSYYYPFFKQSLEFVSGIVIFSR